MEISRYDEINTNIIKTTIFSKNNSNWKRSINWGRKTIKIALAGVGSPEKLVSLTELRLNFASLYEEHIVIKNAETGNKEIIKLDELSITKEDEPIRFNITIEEVSPNVTKSDNESSWTPNLESTFSKKKKKPSKKSQIIPKQTNKASFSRSPITP